MSIFTKRNAAIGYITLKALDRRRRKRSGLKLALYLALGLVSLGILAGLAAVLLRRQHGELQRLEGYAEAEADESDIVGEYVAATPEPISAT